MSCVTLRLSQTVTFPIFIECVRRELGPLDRPSHDQQSHTTDRLETPRHCTALALLPELGTTFLPVAVPHPPSGQRGDGRGAAGPPPRALPRPRPRPGVHRARAVVLEAAGAREGRGRGRGQHRDGVVLDPVPRAAALPPPRQLLRPRPAQLQQLAGRPGLGRVAAGAGPGVYGLVVGGVAAAAARLAALQPLVAAGGAVVEVRAGRHLTAAGLG